MTTPRLTPIEAKDAFIRWLLGEIEQCRQEDWPEPGQQTQRIRYIRTNETQWRAEAALRGEEYQPMHRLNLETEVADGNR